MMGALEEYRNALRSTYVDRSEPDIGRTYDLVDEEAADKYIAELEQERDKYKWQRDEALAEHCAMVEHEYGISHWPTEEQPPTLDDWLDDDEAVAKWVAEKVADLDRRWEGRS
jgi:hypothetical protein